MSELKPEPCKKCGSDNIRLEFKAGGGLVVGTYAIPIPERMEAICNNCGHVWIVPPLDAQ